MLKRICWQLLFTCLVIGTSWAADDPFVGKWRLNPSRSKLSDARRTASPSSQRPGSFPKTAIRSPTTLRAPRPKGQSLAWTTCMNGLLGTAGFAGTWESDSVQVNSVFEFQIEPYEEDGLSFINPAEQTTKNIKFDGKDYPGSGPNLPKGFTTSGHRVSALTIQLTDKLAGKIVDTRQVDLSSDLKTLTMTVRTMNHNKPNILVFERE